MRLIDSAATFEKTLPSGVVVTLRPLDGPLFHAAQMAAATRAQASEGWPEGLDRENDAHRLGVGLSLMAQEMARLAVVAWSGVEDAEGEPLDCTPANATMLARAMPHDGEAIRDAVTRRSAPALVEGQDEGNASAPD